MAHEAGTADEKKGIDQRGTGDEEDVELRVYLEWAML